MVSPEIFMVVKSEWGTMFSVSILQRKEEYQKRGQRTELITSGGRIEEVDEFCYLEMYWIARLD